MVTLAPGAFTAVLRGNNSTTGIGLVEVYDLDAPGQAKVINISTRGFLWRSETVSAITPHPDDSDQSQI
jgi:hypothetical protein